MKVLLVEADQSTAADLIPAIAAHHYQVNCATDGQAGLELALAFEYDLILLNLQRPKLYGLHFCQQLRAQGNLTPILLLIAPDAVQASISGLEAGADDYLVQPFDLSELIARMHALLRRRQTLLASELVYEHLRLDTSLREARYGKKLLRLTPKEYGILELFLQHPRRVFSRSAMIDKLWDFAEIPGEETVTSHIKALRQKLRAAGAPQDLIETVHGLGYRLRSLAPLPEVPAAGAAGAIAPRPAPSEQAQVQEFMGEFWEQFRSTFAEQIHVLQQTRQAVAAGQVTPELHQQARLESHKLAGSLGTFGYPHGSVLARQLEALLSSPTLTLEHTPQLNYLVQALKQAVDQPPTFLGSIAPPVTQARQVLVIDQTPGLAEQLQRAAQGWSQHPAQELRQFQVTGITDLAQVSATIAQAPPHLILVNLPDSHLAAPEQNLLQTLGEQFPQIPSVVLTADTSLARRVELGRLGGRTLLQKPVSCRRILQMLNQVLDQEQPSEGKVLLVDDDPLILLQVCAYLEPWGLQIKTLEDPSQFLEVLNSFAPDLLLLDVEMPGFSGIDLCRVVRNDPAWGDLPVLFLTAHTESDLLYAAFSVGIDDYIRKPIVEPELVTRIISRLDRVRLLQQSSKLAQKQSRNWEHGRTV